MYSLVTLAAKLPKFEFLIVLALAMKYREPVNLSACNLQFIYVFESTPRITNYVVRENSDATRRNILCPQEIIRFCDWLLPATCGTIENDNF